MIVVLSFAIYTLAIIGIGLYSARYARPDNDDYFLAGRTLGPWVAALSASASGSSGWVTMGLVGSAFALGVRVYWVIPGVLLGVAFNWFVMAGRLRDRAAALGAVTLPDLLSFQFRERLPLLRVLSVVVILVAMFLYVAAQLAAAGKAFDASFPGLGYRGGVIIGVIVVLGYTVIGGFRATCWTDFAQAILMLAALVVMPVYLLVTHGGFGPLFDQLGAADSALVSFLPDMSGLALLGFLLGAGAMGVGIGYPGQPHVLVRFMAMRDRRDARIGGVIALVWVALSFGGAVTVGLFARALSEGGATWGQAMLEDPQSKGELALVIASQHLMPGMIAGLILAGILSAIASTADSQLIVAASSVANDLYARLVRTARGPNQLVIDRAVVLVLGIGAGLLVLDRDVRVYSFVLTYGWSILGAAFGPQLILLLFWKRASYAGCLAGMATGFTVAVLWPELYDAKQTGIPVYNLTVAFAAALGINALVSAFSPRSPARPEKSHHHSTEA